MGSVIITDDVTQMRDSLTNALKAEGHDVFLAEGETMLEMVNNAVRLADEHADYVLVLDFNLKHGPRDGEIWGGIWLYVAMRDRGALEVCRRALVGSRYIPADVRSLRSALKPTDAFIARVFVELEGIPDEDIFKLDVNDAYQKVARRVSEIFKEAPIAPCAGCGKALR
jgi:hypothetical protein